jgi:hypothetical protein
VGVVTAVPPFPFKDDEVRGAWLDCLKFMQDDELITYRDWLQVAKDQAFECLVEDGIFREEVLEYVEYVTKLNEELAHLNRNNL